MTDIIPARQRPQKIKFDEFANTITIKRTGKDQPDIVLPLSADDNQKLIQLQASSFRHILDEFTATVRTAIQKKELTPLQMKQLGEAYVLAQKLQIEAWKTPDGSGDGEGTENAADLIAAAVDAGQMLQRKKDELEKKNKPVEIEAKDVSNG